MLDFNDKRTLKVLMFVVLFHSSFQILNFTISFVNSYFNLKASPLLPDDLISYVGFPLFFLIPIFCGFSYLALKSLLSNEFNKMMVFVLLTLTILYVIFGSTIYSFIMKYNPYG